MSSSILKAGFIQFNMDETRVINSNEVAESFLNPAPVAPVYDGGETEDGVRPWTGTDFGAEGQREAQLDGLTADGVFQDTEKEPAEEGSFEETYGGGEEEPASLSRAEAEQMIAQAEEEIRQMKEEALSEIENMKAQAVEEARIEGRDAGYQQGYQEGREAAEAEYAAKEAELSHAMEQYDHGVEELEPLMVEKLTGIYEHVFHVDLSENREIILHLLDKALHGIDTGAVVTIRAAREDYPYINMQKKRLLAGISNNVTVEVVEDANLAQNQCLIETENGIFDCSVDVELRALSKTLQLLAYEG